MMTPRWVYRVLRLLMAMLILQVLLNAWYFIYGQGSWFNLLALAVALAVIAYNVDSVQRLRHRDRAAAFLRETNARWKEIHDDRP